MEEKNSSEPLITTSTKDNVLLSNETGEVKYQNKSAILTLTTTKLIIEVIQNKQTKRFNLNDFLGATINSSGKNSDQILLLHMYGFKPAGCCSCSTPTQRVQSTIELVFPDSSMTVNWANTINCTLRNVPITRSEDNIAEPPPVLKYLVFVNPVGGTGNAVNIWNGIRSFLDHASIQYNLLITERANHAKDTMATCNLNDITAVVIVGGDGLIFEVVSGMMSREDSQEQLSKIIFAPIPGGSGNGLIKSILHESNEEYSPENAMFVAIRGKSTPLDLSKVETLNHKYVSFLILGWGFISDCDILSENMRWMGEMRFTVAAVQRLALKKLYRGRLSMLLQSSSSSTSSSPATESSTDISSNSTNYSLPPLDTPIDTSVGEWKVIEDDFILVWILQTSHCSSSMYSCPGAKLNDGILTIFVVRNISRFSLLTLLLGFDSGDHINHSQCEVYKALAYRLEPLTTEGLYSLDGEVVEYGPIQGSVQPSAMKVFAL